MHRSGLLRRLVATPVALAGVLAIGPLGGLGTASAAETPPGQELYLVTLTGPGVAGTGSTLPAELQSAVMSQQQSALLASVAAPEPVYRWTTALNGVAVRLDAVQAARLAADPAVALVEPNTVLPLAGTSTAGSLGTAARPRASGGSGTVIGVIDTGIDPDSPLFAPVSGAAVPDRFVGSCQDGQDWSAAQCSTKLVGAAWFVDGFGAERVRAASSLSARDDDGHGTQMASLAAGNSGLPVRVGRTRLGEYAGRAPDARVATYKACWTAPDPADDGCASADLVSAIDRAAADRVDVLNLSVSGSSSVDTVERALLGATEAGVLTVAAAGNRPGAAAHPSPWVLTVGGSSGEVRRGTVRLPGGRSLDGASSASRGVGPARLVLAGDVPAEGVSRRDARLCAPGSLDAGRVADRIVLCARGGGVGRVLKSEAVRQADGVGMVLGNPGAGSLDADFHAVPTVHLDARDTRALRRWALDHPRARVSLRAARVVRTPRAVVGFSRSGDPRAGVVKPDLVAPASGLVGAVPSSLRGAPWDLVSGTSAAAAQVSGDAAMLIARRGWTPDVVRSALTTTAAPIDRRRVLRSGSGLVDADRAVAPGLSLRVPASDYRGWLDDRSRRLNLPSIVLAGRRATTTRQLTNLGRRTRGFSVAASGFARHDVTVTPSVVRIAPGSTATVVVTATADGRPRRDGGYLTWTGPGSSTRVPVLLTR